jgi:hypothetical protein
MKIVGCDLHAKQQAIAMVDTETGEFTERTLAHEGNQVREFYAALEGPVVVGIEATGAPCSGFCNCWKSSGSSAGWDIRRRSGPKRRGNRSTIGGMPDWS